MSDAKIPFLYLVTVHRELQDEFVEIFKAALDSAGFIGGPMVQGFEEDFAKFCESRFCVGVGSGTTGPADTASTILVHAHEGKGVT